MSIRTMATAAALTTVVTAMAVGAASVLAPTAEAQGKLQWDVKLNDTRGPLRSLAASAPKGKAAESEILGGPTSGSENAYLIYTKMPAGSHGPAMFTLPADDNYVVLTGKLNVQIGTDKFTAGPMTGVIIPANTPHTVWNEGAELETHLQVIASAHPEKDLSRDLMSMLKPANATAVANAAKMIREIKLPAPSELKPGLNRQVWTNKSMGSPITVAIDSTSPGQGGPNTHIHAFEQVYFMVDGQSTITYGLTNPVAKKGDIVILPPGVIHTNSNKSSAIERHITLLLPEPDTQPFDIEFERKGAVGQ